MKFQNPSFENILNGRNTDARAETNIFFKVEGKSVIHCNLVNH